MAGPFQTVVVPGILGSQLSTNAVFGTPTVVWPNPALLAGASPLVMALAGDGHSPYPVLGWPLFPSGPVGYGIYDSVVRNLTAAGLTPFFWAYDWRLDLRALASQFVAFLGSTNISGNFTVVAHSMGGLVAQLAYPAWVAAGNNPRWASTMYLNTPQGGAHWAAMCLNGLFYDGALMNLLGQIYNVATISSPALATAYSLLAGLLGQAVGSWPAVYQLLPSNSGPWNNLDPLAGNALSIANYAAGPGGVQQQWLTAAAAVQAALVAQYTQPRPFEFQFNGTGLSTPRAFALGGNPQSLSGYVYTTFGDGTVANERSSLPNTLGNAYTGSTHNGLLTSYIPLVDLVNANLTHPSGSLAKIDLPTPPVLVSVGPPPPATAVQSTWADQFANKTGDP